MYIKHQIIMPGIFSATQMLHPYALKWCFSINTCRFHRVQHSPHCLRSDLVFENKDRHLHQRKAELFTVGESMVSWGPDLKSYLQDPPPTHTHTWMQAGGQRRWVGTKPWVLGSAASVSFRNNIQGEREPGAGLIFKVYSQLVS